jgi:hypothetical protein
LNYDTASQVGAYAKHSGQGQRQWMVSFCLLAQSARLTANKEKLKRPEEKASCAKSFEWHIVLLGSRSVKFFRFFLIPYHRL